MFVWTFSGVVQAVYLFIVVVVLIILGIFKLIDVVSERRLRR